MNSIFNINRFIKYLKTFAATYSNQYLYLLLIVGGYTLVGLLLYIIVPMIFPALSFPIIYGTIPLCVGLIVLAPCFFEKTISKNNSIFDFILPVSSFEKFLTRLLNYVIVVPVLLMGSVYILSEIGALLSADNAEAVRDALSLSNILTYKNLMAMAIIQSFYWMGYHYFRRYTIIKSTITMFISILAVAALSMLVVFFVFGDFETYKTMNVSVNINLTTNDIEDMIAIPRYILSFLFPLGPWLVCMLKIRETEI